MRDSPTALGSHASERRSGLAAIADELPVPAGVGSTLERMRGK